MDDENGCRQYVSSQSEKHYIAILTIEVVTDQVPAEKIDDLKADKNLENIYHEDECLNKDTERGSSMNEKMSHIEEKAVEPRDPNLVDWDGPDDPENPLNWTTGRKAMMTTSIALITFLTYVSIDSNSHSSTLSQY